MKFVCISMRCKIPHCVQSLQIIYFIFRVNSVFSHLLEFTLPPKAMLVPKSCVPKQSQWFLYLRDPINSKLPGSSGKGWLARIPTPSSVFHLHLTENSMCVESKGTPNRVCQAEIVILFSQKTEAEGHLIKDCLDNFARTCLKLTSEELAGNTAEWQNSSCRSMTP